MISFNLSKLECYDANHHEKNHSIDNLYSKTRCYRCQLRCFFFLGRKRRFILVVQNVFLSRHDDVTVY